MNDFAAQISVVVGVLTACFVGPAVAVYFMLRRKRQARARRRSPIGRDLLRGPGHSLQEQLEAAGTDLGFDLALLMIVPLLMLSVFLAQGHLLGLSRMMHLALLYAVLALAFILWAVRKLWKAGTQLDNLKAGYDAELAVGQELDQLMRRGAYVFHDVPADNFNIDHVVVSGQGIFAVETKGFTKPKRGGGNADATVVFDGQVLKFPTWATREPLDQADRQAAWIGKWLSSATGAHVSALPVLALPGWFVDRTGRGAVRVFNGKELAGLLDARGAQGLSAQQIQQVAHQLEQRCRTVAPRYSEEARAS
jgi:Nuclease-related domain